MNHLLIVDDCVLFSKAKKEEWRSIYSILQVYECASGQVLNKQKTSIFFSSNTKREVIRRIYREAGAVVCDNYERYLGLPAVVGKARYNAFRNLKERVWMKLQNWKNNFLSNAGK